MNFGSRFTEFGMTGAFFWIGQLIILTNFYTDQFPPFLDQWYGLLTELSQRVPPAFHNMTATLLSTFGIIGIFVTGLILDLLGAPYTIIENHILGSKLRQNKSWIEPLFKESSRELFESYNSVAAIFSPKNLFLPTKSLQRLRHMGDCKKLQSFLFSYIHIYSSNSTSDLLTDNMHLWRTCRAIATTLLILAIEILFIRDEIKLLKADQAHDLDLTKTLLYIILIIIALLLTIVSYNRMCHTLFALTGTTYNKSKHG